MKKITLLIALLILTTTIAQAAIKTPKNYAIPSTANGVQLKCTGEKISGSIEEYSTVTDYYTFKGGKIYANNLAKMYKKDKNPKKRKMLKQKITTDTISFKDRLYQKVVSNYKWVEINRKTGEYYFHARREYFAHFKRAEVKGYCQVINSKKK